MRRVLHELLQVLQRLLAVGRAVAVILQKVITVRREDLRAQLLGIAGALATRCAYLVHSVSAEIVSRLLILWLFVATAFTLRVAVTYRPSRR